MCQHVLEKRQLRLCMRERMVICLFTLSSDSFYVLIIQNDTIKFWAFFIGSRFPFSLNSQSDCWNYIWCLVNRNNNIRSSKQYLLEVPKVKRQCYGARSFWCADLVEWNQLLPIELKVVPSLSIFKSKLKYITPFLNLQTWLYIYLFTKWKCHIF